MCISSYRFGSTNSWKLLALCNVKHANIACTCIIRVYCIISFSSAHKPHFCVKVRPGSGAEPDYGLRLCEVQRLNQFITADQIRIGSAGNINGCGPALIQTPN